MKRFHAVFLAVLIFISAASACCADGRPAHVEGSIFGGRSEDSIAVDVRFDPGMLTGGCNTEYSRDLAGFSALLCADSYFRDKDFDRGTPNRLIFDGIPAGDYDHALMLRECGFTDVRYIESFREKEYAYDGNDSVTLLLGFLEADGYDVFTAVVRGVFSSGEWYSVFDIGCSGENYAALTGEHPEWTDMNCAKGIDIAAGRALEIIREYIACHDDPQKENLILITGHSRGGSIAGMLGAEFEDDPDFKSFTYTFDAACFTSDPDCGRYTTIFNIFDGSDLFSGPIFGNGFFRRYGMDLSFRVADSAEMRGALAALRGRDDCLCLSPSALSEYAELFSARFPSRDAVYDPCELTETFDTEEEALSRLHELEDLIGSESGLGLEALCSVSRTPDDSGCSVTLSYCGGALLITYGKILAYGGPAYDAAASLFSGDEAGLRIAGFLSANAAAISGGHLLASCYVLSGLL